MNKGIILLILLVVLGAMGLVMYSHNKNGAPASSPGAVSLASAPSPAASDNAGLRDGYASPLQPPQGGNGGPRPIEPSIGSVSGADGAPIPVTLPAGADTRSVRPIVPPKPETPAPTTASRIERPAQAQAPAKPGGTGSTGVAGTTGASSASGASSPAGSGSAPGQPWGETPAATMPPNPHQPPVTNPIINEKSLSKTGTHTLRAINLRFAGQQMQLHIEAGDPFPVKSFALTNPDRLVIDLPGIWKGMKAPSVPNNNIVGKIRLGSQPGGPRLVLDLKGALKNYRIERTGNRVDILVR